MGELDFLREPRPYLMNCKCPSEGALYTLLYLEAEQQEALWERRKLRGSG